MGTEHIEIIDAWENNLKHVSLCVPKHKITVFTGVSGSGKSSLVMDTIAAQSRRELNDTFSGFIQQYLPKYGRPHVGRIKNLPVAIVVDQKKPATNQRSTVGTYTDAYTLLRLLFSRVGRPFVGYSDRFSFNHPQGSCPCCDGIGEITELDIHKLVDFDKCLNDPGVIHYVAFEPGQWRWIRYACSGLFDLNKKIRDYSKQELELFLYSPQIRLKNPGKGWPKTAKYEGLIHRMYRSVLNSEEGKRHREILESMTKRSVCPQCHGTRLNQEVLSCRINGLNIAEAAGLPFPQLLQWLKAIESPVAADIKRTLRIRRYISARRTSGSVCVPRQPLTWAQRMKSERFSQKGADRRLRCFPSMGKENALCAKEKAWWCLKWLSWIPLKLNVKPAADCDTQVMCWSIRWRAAI